jgi:hypothetical protein
MTAGASLEEELAGEVAKQMSVHHKAGFAPDRVLQFRGEPMRSAMVAARRVRKQPIPRLGRYEATVGFEIEADERGRVPVKIRLDRDAVLRFPSGHMDRDRLAVPRAAPVQVALDIERREIAHPHRARQQDLDRDRVHDIQRRAGRPRIALDGALREARRQEEQQFDVVDVVELGEPGSVLFRHPLGVELETASDGAERLDLGFGQFHVVTRDRHQRAGHAPEPTRRLAAIAIEEETQPLL